MPRARRLNHGRYHSYELDGAKVVGVTTVLDAMAKPALVNWAARETASFAVENLKVLGDMLGSGGKEACIDYLKGAPYRERDAAANRGGEVHRIAEQLQRGQTVDVPEELQGHVDSYLKFDRDWPMTEGQFERPVFNTRFRYGGTFDCLGRFKDLGLGLVDYKTNRSGAYGETGLQLSAYQGGDRYGPAYSNRDGSPAQFFINEQGLEVPMPKVDFFGVVWLRGDDYAFYPYEVTERDYKTFLYLLHVHWWREHRQDSIKQNEMLPGLQGNDGGGNQQLEVLKT